MAEKQKLKFTAGDTIETDHDANRGTLGVFVKIQPGDRKMDGLAPGDICLLTAGHVLFPGFVAGPNIGVYSPDFSSCCSSGDRMATVAFDPDAFGEAKTFEGKYTGSFRLMGRSIRGTDLVTAFGSIVDCGLAKVDDAVEIHNAWPDGTVICGDVLDIQEIDDPRLGIRGGPRFGTLPMGPDYARIWQPGFGVVHGTMFSPTEMISLLDDPDKLLYSRQIVDVGGMWESDNAVGVPGLVDHMLFLPRPTPQPTDTFESAYARSVPSLSSNATGSVVLNSQGFAIGMVSRVVPTSNKAFEGLPHGEIEVSRAPEIAVCQSFQWTLDHLGVRVPKVATGFARPAAARGAQVQVGLDLAQREGVERLRTGLRESRRGRVLMAKVTQHRREIKQLFAGVRAIAAAWRELQGAGFYAHCVEGVRDPEHRVPDAINGVTRARLVEVLLPLVEQHASPALARDVRRYRAWAIANLLPVRSIADVPDAAKRGHASKATARSISDVPPAATSEATTPHGPIAEIDA